MLPGRTTVLALARMCLCILLAGALSACAPRSAEPSRTAGATPEFTSEDGIQQADEISIYAAVIRQLYTQDDTFGGTLRPPTVYVIGTTDDAKGDPDAPKGDPRVISAAVQEGVTSAVADLPATIRWVDSRDDVALDPSTDKVADGGVIVTLGNIHPRDDGVRAELSEALVTASIYIANLAAGGQTYVLQQVDGEWQVTGNTGVIWMS